MSPRKKKNVDPASIRLTDVELELMTILWKRGEGGVHDVLQALPKGRELAYTSVSTILRILEQKGFLRARKAGEKKDEAGRRGHIYVPQIQKSTYESAALHHLVQQVFDNAPGTLLRRLVESQALSASDLSDLRRELDQLTGEKHS